MSAELMRPVVGDAITPRTFHPTAVQLFRFSATTWNAHRIHYDKPYAQEEGYPDVLVQSHLHAAFLARTVCDWAGPAARLLHFAWENRAIAVPGDELTCTGEVIEVEESDGLIQAVCALTENNQAGVLCAPARAKVAWRRPQGGADA